MFGLIGKFFKREDKEPLFPDWVLTAHRGPIPGVSLGTVKSWAYQAANKRATHLIIIFEHNLYDDIREVYPWEAYHAKQAKAKIHSVSQGIDASVVGVIDLSQDIDSQLTGASFVA